MVTSLITIYSLALYFNIQHLIVGFEFNIFPRAAQYYDIYRYCDIAP